MAVVEGKLAEAVRKYTVLYDKGDKFFKDRNKKRLAWEDVAKEANFTDGKRIKKYTLLIFRCSVFKF